MASYSSVKALAERVERKNSNSANLFLNGVLKDKIFARLKQLQFGSLTILYKGDSYQFSGDEYLHLTAKIEVNHEQFFRYLAFGGSVGAAEAYINNYWSTDDLTNVIRLFALNQAVMDSVDHGMARVTAPLKQFFHYLNKNTQRGSKRNIVAHYDLGNDFFEQFLDSSMMYSSGIFCSLDESMEQASINKLERICKRLRLNENDHVLEIGTGWGSFAIYAAKNYGCRVTTTTISNEQFLYARERIREEGLDEKITLLDFDYRKLTGKFDKLVSIEMIEAVGHHYFPVFFEKCSSLLKDNGEMLLQAITIQDQRFDSAKKHIDFIKRYIFPGSCIPSIDSISECVTRDTDLRMLALDDIGVHYAETLKRWRETFFSNISQIKAQGFSENFIRMWEFYFCYCEGGFRERVISDIQLHLVKPLARVPMKLSVLKD
ncbi:cyclopropane-fatty-acyl-phospholipid synthase family protein [Aliikangiella sp. G2MR2-5]|uniref:SAM-dependent methyltransferase n=1 Tax=Aliikangiella sp. G2MR2-5 TaxID=2788943 RepID=UPI0018ABC6CD|nr:cyclopropane-fatty-acyl-phospholipid synthase family protein [Aliikangiella sp. G2MR2-5]